MSFETFWKGAQILAIGVLAAWLKNVGIDVETTSGKVREATQHVEHTTTKAGEMQDNVYMVLGQVKQAAQHNYTVLTAVRKALLEEGILVQNDGSLIAQAEPTVTYIEVGDPPYIPPDGSSVVIVEAGSAIVIVPSTAPSFLTEDGYEFEDAPKVNFKPPPSIQQMEQIDDGE